MCVALRNAKGARDRPGRRDRGVWLSDVRLAPGRRSPGLPFPQLTGVRSIGWTLALHGAEWPRRPEPETAVASTGPQRWFAWGALLAALSPAGTATAASLFLDGFEATPGFVETPPAMSVAAGVVETRCYYFRAPATAQSVRRISSLAGPGVAHLILYATYVNGWTPQELQPPGTVAPCPTSAFTGWLHVAHDAAAETVLPADDGTGARVGFALAAGQPLVLQVRLVNVSEQPQQAQVQLAFDTWPPALQVTPAASYLAFNNSLSIPPGSTDVETRTCPVPAGVRFWRFTARTHLLGTRMRLLDGATVLLDGSDWQHPPVTQFAAPPFHAFANALTYECTYFNHTDRNVTSGSDESSDEACMGIGWFFPATRPMLCVDQLGPL
jgi:hypothetical protein